MHRWNEEWRCSARVFCAVLLVWTVACGPDEPARAPVPTADAPGRAPVIDEARRALIIGIDGATLEVVEPLIAAGRLPHLASIAEAGLHGSLTSAMPIQSPRIWNTIATGKTPQRHGILSFTFDAPNGDRRLYLSHHRKVPALWNILSHHGLSVSAVNWWNTWPPERINGVMVSDHFFPGQLSGREDLFKAEGGEGNHSVSPVAWEERARRALESAENPTAFDNPFLARGALPRWTHIDSLADVFETDRRVAQTALAIAEAEDPQVLMVYFPGIDRVCHSLWIGVDAPESFPPAFRLDEPTTAATRRAVENYYAFTDALIGRLLEGYDSEDLVIVLSDHGFEAHTFGDPVNGKLVLTGGHESPKARDGLLFARGRGVAHRTGLDGMSIQDVAPTLLAWLGLPVGSDMDGEVSRFLASETSERVASYDDLPIEREAANASAVEGEIVDQLRELGYLE